MKFEISLPIIDSNCPLYIRFGDIPEDEQSSIHYRNYYCGHEKGVSVFDCVVKNGQPHIVMPYPWSEAIVDDLTGFYPYNRTTNVYLVTGTEIGRGTDNEPIITNVKIIQDITDEWRADFESWSGAQNECLMRAAEHYGCSETTLTHDETGTEILDSFFNAE